MNTFFQCRAILNALLAGETLTHLEAERRFNCSRIAARVKDLRDGKLNRTRYEIQTVMVSQDGKRFARYYLPSLRVKIIQQLPSSPVVSKPSNSLF